MNRPDVHETLSKLAQLEAEGRDISDQELEDIEQELLALPKGALDAALGDLPDEAEDEDDVEEEDATSPGGLTGAVPEQRLDDDVPVFFLGARAPSPRSRGAGGSEWENWSKNYRASEIDIRVPRTLGELINAVQAVADARGTVKPIGAGYSCSKASQPYRRGTAINTQAHLNQCLEVVGVKDGIDSRYLVRVEAGIRLDRLARALAKKELALPNMGGFDKQTLAGVMSTGTHGTGLRQTTFADAVVSVDVVIVEENGRANVHRYEPTNGVTDPARFPQADQFLHQNDDEFYAMVVSCGVTGVVYAYTLRVVDLYFVRETNEAFVFPDDFPAVLARAKAGENLSISIHPNATIAQGKHRGVLNRFERLSRAQVDALNPSLWNNPPTRPTKRNALDYIEEVTGTKAIGWFMANNKNLVVKLIDNFMKKEAGQSFTSVYYKVYPRATGDRFRAIFTELSVPLDDLDLSTKRVLDHVRRNWSSGELLYQVPFALRFVGASKHFLSMHYGRDSGTIEAFALRGSRRPEAALLALEKVLPFARPHFGQLYNKDTKLPELYPDTWEKWLSQYKRANTSGVFNSPLTNDWGITQPRPKPKTPEEFEDVARQLRVALAEPEGDGDLDERHPEMAEFLADEDERVRLLPYLADGAARDVVVPQRDRFDNWLGEGGVFVADIIDDARDLNDLRARLLGTKNPVRVCGKRHSDNLVALPDPSSLVVDLSNWRIRKSAGKVTETNCERRTDAAVRAPYEEYWAEGKRHVRMFAWETLQDIADRGAESLGGDPNKRFALRNSGSFTHQTLAGPVSVGTHGSGSRLGAMCDQVAAVDILGLDGKVYRVQRKDGLFPDDETVVLPDGRGVYTCQPSSADFKASVVNLGTLGVVLSYWIEVVDYYWLTQSVRTCYLSDALTWVEGDLNDQNSPWRHVELLLMPEKVGEEYMCSLIKRAEAPENVGQKGPPELPGIVQHMRCNPEGTRANAKTLSHVKFARQEMYKNSLKFQKQGDGDTGPWSQVLVRNTGVPAYGFEIAVPAFLFKKAISCVLDGIREAGQGHGKNRCKPTSPIGVRFVAASEQYLAMSYRFFEFEGKRWEANAWCFIEVPRLLGTDSQELIPEKIVKRLSDVGVFYRLHWGQYAPPGSRNAAREYPELRNWLGSRIAFGAGPTLLTEHLCAALGLPSPRAVSRTVTPSLSAFSGEQTRFRSSDFSGVRALVPEQREGEREVPPLVLCVHGIGDHRSGEWHEEWREALVRSLAESGVQAPRFVFVGFDDLFQKDGLDFGEFSEAALALTSSWLRYRGRRSASRGIFDRVGYLFDWTLGMVAKWAGDPALRAQLRERVAGAIGGHRPDFVFGHSLGSLVCYDTLTHKETRECTSYSEAARPVHFVSFGSQIGHPSVRFVWGGRLVMPKTTTWTHLYNPNDEIFTAPIRLVDQGFKQCELPDIEGALLEQHAAPSYLGHSLGVRAALVPLFRQRALSSGEEREKPGLSLSVGLRKKAREQAPKRALLVGVNRHADPSFNLEGCVNDVYRVSEILQTRFGYEADSVRMLIDERATSTNIRERLEWLLEDADDDAQRLFYYSGHGVRIPGYNALEVVDQQDEALVPHDFSWADPGTALVDDEFMELYSQLPYSARFTVVFDCCHAGGMSRAGGTNVRGLTPPDDIRHRLMRFDGHRWKERCQWEEKSSAVRAPMASSDAARLRRSFVGGCRSLRPPKEAFKLERELRDHEGPYMPLILYACKETELAFEHRVGTKSHGAFTYALSEYVERNYQPGMAFQDVVSSLSREIQSLGYNQSPTLEGPTRDKTAEFLL